MGSDPDPFRILSLPYDAVLEDVRQAFRRLARETHPDRGGSAGAFHSVRVAYSRLTADLEGERSRWAAKPSPARPALIDRREYPTCTVQIRRGRDGQRRFTYVTDSRPSAWVPGPAPPPGGVCRAQFSATSRSPAFGIWTVPVTKHHFRCVFGPHP